MIEDPNKCTRSTARPVAERLWEKVNIGGPDDCWEFTGSRKGGKQPYGNIGLNGKVDVAHRVAYMVSKGPIPEGMVVRHTCNNPPCCNPNHLVLGTQKDNCKDRDDIGNLRIPHCVGTANGHAKLTDDKVREIRNSTEPERTIMHRYGVSRSVIGRIRRREGWRHVA